VVGRINATDDLGARKYVRSIMQRCRSRCTGYDILMHRLVMRSHGWPLICMLFDSNQSCIQGCRCCPNMIVASSFTYYGHFSIVSCAMRVCVKLHEHVKECQSLYRGCSTKAGMPPCHADYVGATPESCHRLLLQQHTAGSDHVAQLRPSVPSEQPMFANRYMFSQNVSNLAPCPLLQELALLTRHQITFATTQLAQSTAK
jgi:hypothetical protein